MNMLKLFKDRVILVDILAVIFGISSWVAINGLWVQTPLIVNVLPEKWTLSSYIVVITQLANLGPIVYTILRSKFKIETIEKPSIHLILGIGSIASLLLALFWDRISKVNGTEHSVYFLTLTTMLALVDCTTSVLYLPYMSHFKSKYLMSFLIGEALSGLVPSIAALIQGVGGEPTCVNVTGNFFPQYPEPRFSVSAFFIFLLFMVLLSWIAFVGLNQLKSCQSELESNDIHEERLPPVYTCARTDSNRLKQNIRAIDPKINCESQPKKDLCLSRKAFIILMASQAYMCALTNGVLPSVQSYSCESYGNITYHLTVTLSAFAGPIGCCLAYFVTVSVAKRILPVLIGLGTLFSAYILSTALLSPTPPLQGLWSGRIVIVFVWLAMTCLFSFSRAAIASILRNTDSGHKYLFYCGVFTQIGSTIGAFILFALINYTDIFVAYNPCS